MLELNELLGGVKVDACVILFHDDAVAEFQGASYGKKISDSVWYDYHGVVLLVVYELLVCGQETATQGAPVCGTRGAPLKPTNWCVIFSHVCQEHGFREDVDRSATIDDGFVTGAGRERGDGWECHEAGIGALNFAWCVRANRFIA